MFISFFYLLRERGLKPSIDQWMTLMEALDKDLAHSSLVGFYQLCRCIIVNTEADFDKFDEVFIEFFSDVEKRGKMPSEIGRELPDGMMDWLTVGEDKAALYYSKEHMEILQRLMEAIERVLNEIQKEIDSGDFVGNCEVCTGCGLCIRGLKGQGGLPLDEITEELAKEKPKPRAGSALDMAHDRRFSDFREDKVLDIRQFQVAFRRLRQFSARLELPEDILDVDQTVKKTSDNAGLLKLAFEKPRKNTVKLMVLFDSDGSMGQYAEISNKLFQAVSRANNYKDLKFYYYHNCIYDHLYTSPTCVNGDWIDTEYVMKNHDSEYCVIFVGDASMADRELFERGGNSLLERSNKASGLDWLRRFKKKYRKAVWLNPIKKPDWNRIYGGRTIQAVKDVYPMYELTVTGLTAAIKSLLTTR